jgi:hypothetical protein
VTQVLPRLKTLALVLTAVAAGTAGLSAGAQASTPATGAYSSFAYISSSRQGSAVYVNGLVKQNSPTGLIRSAHRTAYLQRDVGDGWQTMLSRVTDSQGTFTVGFISVANYHYRFVVTPSGTALGTTSGLTQTTSPAVRYSNCAALNAVYPHGVGKFGAHDHTASGSYPVLNFIVSSAVYGAQSSARDADQDGVACEKH